MYFQPNQQRQSSDRICCLAHVMFTQTSLHSMKLSKKFCKPVQNCLPLPLHFSSFFFFWSAPRPRKLSRSTLKMVRTWEQCTDCITLLIGPAQSLKYMFIYVYKFINDNELLISSLFSQSGVFSHYIIRD